MAWSAEDPEEAGVAWSAKDPEVAGVAWSAKDTEGAGVVWFDEELVAGHESPRAEGASFGDGGQLRGLLPLGFVLKVNGSSQCTGALAQGAAAMQEGHLVGEEYRQQRKVGDPGHGAVQGHAVPEDLGMGGRCAAETGRRLGTAAVTFYEDRGVKGQQVGQGSGQPGGHGQAVGARNLHAGLPGAPTPENLHLRDMQGIPQRLGRKKFRQPQQTQKQPKPHFFTSFVRRKLWVPRTSTT